MEKKQYEIYNILTPPNTKAKAFDFTDPILDPIFLSNSLQMTLHEAGPEFAAISAPMIGIDARVIYVRGFQSAFFNPIIVDRSEKDVLLQETYPAIPGYAIKVKRPDLIKVRFADIFGSVNITTQTYAGLTSAYIQQQFEIINGEPPFKNVTKFHLDQAIRQMEKRKRVV